MQAEDIDGEDADDVNVDGNKASYLFEFRSSTSVDPDSRSEVIILC